MRIPRSMQILAAGACLLLADTAAPVGASDQLVDVTGKVTPFVTLRSRDNFSSEYRYDVTVRNQRGELIAVFRGRSYTMKGRQTVALPQH